MREDAREFDDGRGVVERRDAGREPEAAHVHVALRESIARHQRLRGHRAASRGAHVHHERLRQAGATDLGEAARQRRRRIHLADARVQQVRARALEAAARLLRQGHDDQQVRAMHFVGVILSAPACGCSSMVEL
jgi:hypothetical protein